MNIVRNLQYSINGKFAELNEEIQTRQLNIVHLSKTYVDNTIQSFSIPLFMATTYLSHRSITLLDYKNHTLYNKEVSYIGISITSAILEPLIELDRKSVV